MSILIDKDPEPDTPEPGLSPTNWWGAAVTRKHLAVCQASMIVLLVVLMGWSRFQEKADIASVRAENRAASDAILNEIRMNNKAAVERSNASVQRANRLNENISQLLGKTDALVKELSSQK